MFASIKNQFKRNKLVKMLKFIVDATQSPTGFAMVPEKEVDEIVASEPTFLTVDKAIKDANGNVKATASTAAISASQGQQATQAAQAAAPPAPKQEFKIEKSIPVPESKRGGRKADVYPFESLEVGDSFFVASTEAKPNPAKSLASTVSSATKRYANATPKRAFTVRAVDGGARIWRVAPKAEVAAAAPAA
jgi:cell division septum initiation protein DivIVA